MNKLKKNIIRRSDKGFKYEYLYPIDRKKIICYEENEKKFVEIELSLLKFESDEEFHIFKEILLRDFDEYGLTKLRFTENHALC